MIAIADVIQQSQAGPETANRRIGESANRRENEADDQLVQQCLAGDRSAFDALVSRYRGRLHALSLVILGNADEAQDVTQETFVRAYEALPRYDCRGQFRVWITTICANLCKNRAKARRPLLSIEVIEAERTVPDPAPNPEDATVAREWATVIRASLERMSERDRLLVSLYYQEDLSIEEIARALKSRTGAVKVALHRARSRLRVILERSGLVTEVPKR